MKKLKELSKDNKWIFSFWGLLVVIAILNVFNFSFISNVIQYIYYGLYILSTFIILLIIIKKMNSKWVFYDDWGVENQIKWIDNKDFNIDGHIINVDTKKVIYGDR